MVHEDAYPPEAVPAAEAQARAALVQAAALDAVAQAGCHGPESELFAGAVQRHLRCVHVGDGRLAVLAVDADGEPRTGPRGPMSAGDVLAELLRDNPGWRRLFR